MKENINIENYEAYLLDWLEGKLSDEDSVQLQAFLALHPEIEVGEGLLDQSLNSSNIDFTEKSRLKKTLSDEDYIAYHEGDLSEAKQKEAEAFIQTNDEAKKTFELFGKLKLQPQKIKFADKTQLKKTGVVFSLQRVVYAASSVAAVFLLMWWLMTPDAQYTPVKPKFSSVTEIEQGEDTLDFLRPKTSAKQPVARVEKQKKPQQNEKVRGNISLKNIAEEGYKKEDIGQIKLAKAEDTVDSDTTRQNTNSNITSSQNINLAEQTPIEITRQEEASEPLTSNADLSHFYKEKKWVKTISKTVIPEKSEFIASSQETTERYTLKLGKFSLTRIASK